MTLKSMVLFFPFSQNNLKRVKINKSGEKLRNKEKSCTQLMQSSNKYLFSTYYVLGIVLDADDTETWTW